MLDQVVECFAPLPTNGRICDATLGGGGHTARLLELCSSCTVVAIDADRTMVRRAETRLGDEPRLSIIHGWFDEVLDGLSSLDRIIMDIGVSMFHLREPERGFSLRDDGPLDMRLDSAGDGESAEMVLRRLNERELADVIFRYGEERYARRIARAIVRERGAGIATTERLAEIVRRAVPPEYRRGRNHPATRTFQALRIVVNDELGRLERALPLAARALAPGGRLAVISFHSLEDRIVKHTFRRLATHSTDEPERSMYEDTGHFRVVTRKPVLPSDAEVRANPASRSAKMRVLERYEGDGER